MIALEDVTVIYPGPVTALDSVSLRIRPGEVAVLLGSSGAGKSTLLRCLNGLGVPSSGRVLLEGIGDLADPALRREHRRRTGMIFQNHQLLGRLSGLQNVLKGRLGYHSLWRSLWPYPDREVRLALGCLERVNLLHRAGSRADRMSGGERQRVGIARALAQEPRLILADEPVASLDPQNGDRVMALLHRICREDGLAAVISLHQVEYARRYADRIVGLSRGRVVFDGPPGELCSRRLDEIYPGQELPAAVPSGTPSGLDGP